MNSDKYYKLGVVIAFGVLRNLPWQPFTLLAPQP